MRIATSLAELDLAGRELRVLGPGQALLDGAGGGDDELAPDAARDRVGLRLLRPVDDDLGDPVAIAEVEEDQLAVVAPAVDPAQSARRARVGGPERTGGVGPIGRGEARIMCVLLPAGAL